MKRIILAMFLAHGAPALAQTANSDAPPAKADDAPPAKAEQSSVAAAPGVAVMDNVVSAFGLLSYWYSESGVGLGARYQKTIAPDGVIKLPNVHDEFGFEAGVDYSHYEFIGLAYNEIALLAGGVWNFWFLKDKLALYPKLELGYRFGSWSEGSIGGYGGLVFQGSAGVVYRLERLMLRAEAGSGSLRLGAGLSF